MGKKMATSDYGRLLKNPKWQRKRLEILNRDDFTCKLCGDKETELHIHHIEYSFGANPWEYENDKLITYCKHCHAIVEDLKGSPEEMAVSVKKRYLQDRGFYALILLATHSSDVHRITFFIYDTEGLLRMMHIREDIIFDVIDLISPFLNNSKSKP